MTSAGATPVRVITDIATPLGLLWSCDDLLVASTDPIRAFVGFDGSTFASARPVPALPVAIGVVHAFVPGPDVQRPPGLPGPRGPRSLTQSPSAWGHCRPIFAPVSPAIATCPPLACRLLTMAAF